MVLSTTYVLGVSFRPFGSTKSESASLVNVDETTVVVKGLTGRLLSTVSLSLVGLSTIHCDTVIVV